MNINNTEIDDQLESYKYNRREFDCLYGNTEIHKNSSQYHDDFKKLQIVKFNLKVNQDNQSDVKNKV